MVDSNAEIKLECGKTSEVDEIVRKEMQIQAEKLAAAAAAAHKQIELAKAAVLLADSDTIGINSINNVVVPTTLPPPSMPKQPSQYRTNKKSSWSSSSSGSSSSGELKMSAKLETKPVVLARPVANTESRLNTSKSKT